MSGTLLIVLAVLPQAAPDTVVVCPDGFREALRPWLDYRAAEGHTIAVTSNTGSSEDIRWRIRSLNQEGRLRSVVLIGDAEPGAERDATLRARCVPADRAKAQVNVLWGSEPHIGTDHWYGDLDGDRTPDVAVGRLTADSPEELRQIVAKILAYERCRDFGPWRRRLNIVAGIGGFGAMTDAVLESTTRYLLTRHIPAGYRLSMTYGSWQSPYCPDPRLFHATTLHRLNEGCWFWVYIGHGNPQKLDQLRVPGGRYHILATSDAPKLHCRHGAPIALFLCCYTGAFDAAVDCLAERMLRQPDGPVAVLAASRKALPYGMAVLGNGLMKQYFRARPATLGEAILQAKRELLKPSADGDKQRAMLDSIASMISPTADKLATERAEHVLLFNLIGDPLLQLRYPEPIELSVPSTATAGEPLTVSGTSAVDGRGTVELIVPRGRLTFEPSPRKEYPQSADALAAFQNTYARANDDRFVTAEVTVRGGRFAVRLDVPGEAGGTCHVRVFVEGVDGFAAGAADVRIRRPAADR